MKPIRVLQVVTIMNRGGLETMLMNYYRHMDRSKIQFDFMVHRSEKGDYDNEILSMGGRIFHMPHIRPGNYRKYFKQLKEFFLIHKEFSVVHAHNNENSSFVLRAAKIAGVPCRIAHSHLSDLGLDIKLPFRIYARMAMKGAPTNYFACSHKAGEWLFGKKAAQEKKVKVLNNAVNISEFQYDVDIRKQIRNELGLDDQLVIGHIGRFNKQKNHEFLIDVFSSLVQKKPNCVLLLVGEGNLRLKMEEKVKNLGLSSKVKFLGVRTDIAKLMQGMDLFLFPSLFEGLPVVLVEAQAAGIQSIVSDSITSEAAITKRIKFISLREKPEFWADSILSSKYEHKDTSNELRLNGYDTGTMTEWLTDYYLEFYNEAK